jgi:hypothetical protein
MDALDCGQFIKEVGMICGGDYPAAFKLLGFVVYVAQEGNDYLLTGNMISQRTYYRWIEIVKRAGWGDLLADARLRQTIKDYLWSRFAGLPIERARRQVLESVDLIISESEAPSLQAIGRQASDAVKGERSESGGREAKPSALDGGANGGSLGEATAPKEVNNTPAM